MPCSVGMVFTFMRFMSSWSWQLSMSSFWRGKKKRNSEDNDWNSEVKSQEKKKYPLRFGILSTSAPENDTILCHSQTTTKGCWIREQLRGKHGHLRHPSSKSPRTIFPGHIQAAAENPRKAWGPPFLYRKLVWVKMSASDTFTKGHIQTSRMGFQLSRHKIIDRFNKPHV